MCRRSVGVHGRVRIVQSNGFRIFFDGLLRTRARARGERERTATIHPSSVDKGGSRYVRFRKRELESALTERKRKRRDGEKKKK